MMSDGEATGAGEEAGKLICGELTLGKPSTGLELDCGKGSGTSRAAANSAATSDDRWDGGSGKGRLSRPTGCEGGAGKPALSPTLSERDLDLISAGSVAALTRSACKRSASELDVRRPP